MGAALWSAILAVGLEPRTAYDTLAAVVLTAGPALQILALFGTRRAIAAER